MRLGLNHLVKKTAGSGISLHFRALILAGSMTTLLFGMVIYTHYTDKVGESQKHLTLRMQTQADLLSALISQTMWDFNSGYLKYSAQSVLENPEVDGILVRDAEGKTVELLGNMAQDSLHFPVSSQINHRVADKTYMLGSIEFSVSKALMRKNLKDYLGNLMFGASAFVIAQLLLLHAMLRHVLRPVQSITSTMLNLAHGQMDLEIPSQNRPDEIGDMARSIQTFKNTALRADALEREIEMRNSLQKELEAARVEADRANQSKSQFLANMSHEIRTPLNGIMGLGEMLLESHLDPQQRYYVGTMLKSSENLLEIINDILDISKIESGRLTLSPALYVLRDVVDEVLLLFNPSAIAKNLSLRLEYSPDIPRYLIGDYGYVRQILTNLVGNAIKFTETGGISVYVDAMEIKDDTVLVRIGVQDSGIGIAQAKQDKIFEKFLQEDSSTTRRFGGSGLGLAICRELAEAMGGEIRVESELGKGSTFYCSIWQDYTAQDEVCMLPSYSKSSKPVTLEGKRILVAEDNGVNSMILTRLLQKSGCVVEVMENGKQVLEAMRGQAFDLVLMDCQMPEMDGFEATRRLKEWMGRNEINTVPIIALTAHAMDTEKKKCLDAGMDDFISKPFKQEVLMNVVYKWISAENRASAIG